MFQHILFQCLETHLLGYRIHGDNITCRYLLYGATAWLHHFYIDSSPPFIVLEDVWAHGPCLLFTLLLCPDDFLVSFAQHMPEGEVLTTLVSLYNLVVIIAQPLPDIFEDTLPICYLPGLAGGIDELLMVIQWVSASQQLFHPWSSEYLTV